MASTPSCTSVGNEFCCHGTGLICTGLLIVLISNGDRFNIEDATPPDIPSRTKGLYQWNPCSPWTAQSLPNETAENHCKEVAVGRKVR